MFSNLSDFTFGDRVGDITPYFLILGLYKKNKLEKQPLFFSLKQHHKKGTQWTAEYRLG